MRNGLRNVVEPVAGFLVAPDPQVVSGVDESEVGLMASVEQRELEPVIEMAVLVGELNRT